jgi:hypothetical protein
MCGRIGKSVRRLRWAGHVSCMGGEVHAGFQLENLKGTNLSEDLVVDYRD